MDENFKNLISEFNNKYNELISMAPLMIDSVPSNCPVGGVYLFSENGIHLYTGRTKRLIKDRLKDHVCTADDCPFAFLLAREQTGNVNATYTTDGGRRHLLSQPHFREAYNQAKDRIRKMEVRYVGESNPTKQALFEIYVAVVAEAKYNDFDTT